MFKVLIVDDEPIIRNGLKSIIDWNKYGFIICGEAINGREGLIKADELKPELLIVDIKMPEMDGIKMVEELRKVDSHCKIIILTAYNDFKYAQKAIEFGVASYILKPIEEIELIEKICKIRDLIYYERAAINDLQLSVSLSRDKILESLILGQADSRLWQQYNKLYGFDFPWKAYRIVLVDMDRNVVEYVLKIRIRNEMENYITKNNYGYVFFIDKFIGILLNNYGIASIFRLFTNLQTRVKEVLMVDLFISTGCAVEKMDHIQKSYENAHDLIGKKFIYGYKQMIMDGKENDTIGKSDLTSDINIEMVYAQLYSAIDANNMNLINDLMEKIRLFYIHCDYSEEAIKINYTNLYSVMINRLLMNNEALMDHIDNKGEVLNEIHKMTCFQELCGYIKYKLYAISDSLDNLRHSDHIQKILDYIDKNYDKDLKLDHLAVLFNYNCAYLGRLIKRTTGEYFNTYLDRVRLEKVKQFLKEGMKVYEAAEKAGYKDVDYFYKKFKKYVGVSPTDFKSQFRML